MKKIKIESSKINLDCVTCALSGCHEYRDSPGRVWKLTEKDNDRRKGSNDGRVSALLHDIVYSRNRETAEYGWQGTHPPVWNVINRVAVTDVREVKVALEANKPSRKGDQQLRKWGVDVEVILATKIIGSELAEMNLIEAIETKD